MKGAAAILILFLAAPFAAGRLPDLYPPENLIEPSFWEQHRWTICCSILLGSLTAILVRNRLKRPHTAPVCPPATTARRQLEPLASAREDGSAAGKVSRILRDYFASTLGLSDLELTAEEWTSIVNQDKAITSEIRLQFIRLLRDCDAKKFGTDSDESKKLAARALELIETMEACRMQSALASNAPQAP